MKFVCPLCESDGSISEDNLIHPVTKTTCRQCGTILLVNPDTGSVDAHKSPLKGTREFAVSANQTSETDLPVLERDRTHQGSRDWTAIIIVLVVLAVLISVGVYLMFHPGTLHQSILFVAKLIEALLGSGRAGA